MDVNTANILPLIWATKFNLGLPNLAEPISNISSTPIVNNLATTNQTHCSPNSNRPNMTNGPSNLWPAAAAAALSNDLTTSFKQLLANAAAAAVNVNGIGSTFSQSPSDTTETSSYGVSNQTNGVTNGFTVNNGNMNSNSNGSNGSNLNRPLSPTTTSSINGLSLQQALMARLGQAAAILGDNNKPNQRTGGNYAIHNNNTHMQLSNCPKMMHLMPNYGNTSSPGRFNYFRIFLSCFRG